MTTHSPTRTRCVRSDFDSAALIALSGRVGRFKLLLLWCSACSLSTPSVDDYTHGYRRVKDAGSMSPEDAAAEHADAGARHDRAAEDAGTLAPDFAAQPLLWLAADRGVTVDELSLVTRWEDQSGHERHAVPGPANRPPARSLRDGDALPFLVFDGADELTLPAFDSFGELSFFAVAETAEEDRRCPSILHLCNWKDAFIQLSDVEFGRHQRELYYENNVESVPSGIDHTDTFSVGRPHVLSVVHEPTEMATTYVDAQPVHMRRMLLPDPVTRVANYIGQNHFFANAMPYCDAFKGRIAELLFFDHAMTNAEREQVERYLSQKWSVPHR